ncbi:hypothetical protein JG677_07685 [Campylobacter sp. TTU-622]|uniref:hypothetical protein n=1 Tax=Campylobacter sp. TTU-622 TaxID=2800583 RepID=UPI0019053FD5|nr:hypothetical protein [Campylobacter sp. TTU-622]MBK1973923.1 hypothetical protein [Campylobacter sp. TTU-622]
MKFKKADINENTIQDIKEFADNASGENLKQEDKKTRKRKEESKRNKFPYKIFLGDELKNRIQKEFVGSGSEFLRKIILEKNSYFEDKDIIEIYNLIQKEGEGLSPKSSIRKKFGLETTMEKFDYDKKNQKNSITTWINSEDKEKIKENITLSHSTMRAYGHAKILFYLETKDLFSFEEQMKLIKEAKDYNLDFKEFLILKIKG